MDTAEFLDTIYRQEEGYCYVAVKTEHSFDRKFFAWPEDRSGVLTYIKAQAPVGDVYYAPALFKSKSSKKTEVKGAHCYWVEFDGKLPETLGEIPEPNLKLQSSEPGHEHWYWLTDDLVSADVLDKVNRALTYILGADVSGWDASQILRPPGTLHHSSEATVKVLSYNPEVSPMEAVYSAPEPPPVLEFLDEKLLPSIKQVLKPNDLPSKLLKLFQLGSQDRSDGLMSLGYGLAELGFSVEDMLVILIDADYRWGKFAKREDKLTRLSEIIVRAKLKYPDLEATQITGYSLFELFETKIEFEWLWQDLLPKQGYLLLSGPSGLGKTQLSLNAMIKFALGQDFLQEKVSREMKLGFFSLELNLMELKMLLQKQVQGLSEKEQKHINETVRLYPIGEPLQLQLADERDRVESIIRDDELEGVFFDSLGSMTEEELSSESIKGMMNWNDKIRQRLKIFTWLIHHHRKPSGDNKKPNKLGDVYGSMFVTRNVTTGLCLWKDSTSLELLTLKNRFAQEADPIKLTRDGNLMFSRASGLVIKNGDPVGENIDPETGLKKLELG